MCSLYPALLSAGPGLLLRLQLLQPGDWEDGCDGAADGGSGPAHQRPADPAGSDSVPHFNHHFELCLCSLNWSYWLFNGVPPEETLLQCTDLASCVRLLKPEHLNTGLELIRRIQERLLAILQHSTQVTSLRQTETSPNMDVKPGQTCDKLV